MGTTEADASLAADPHGAGPCVHCEERDDWIPIPEFLRKSVEPNVGKDGVPNRLEDSAATFRQRNSLYGDNWLHFGKAMQGIFPDGARCESLDDWNRMGILVQCVAKLTRYGVQFAQGGHLDSAHDLCVYAAMLEELTARSLKAKE